MEISVMAKFHYTDKIPDISTIHAKYYAIYILLGFAPDKEGCHAYDIRKIV